MSCEFCKCLLKDDELSIYRKISKDKDASADILAYHYVLVCKKHWCTCMPSSTPWGWINKCDQCTNMICKSCWCIGKNGQYMCNECMSKSNQ